MEENKDLEFEEGEVVDTEDEYDVPADVVTLYDEDGKGTDFVQLDMISLGEDVYAVLYPIDEESQDGELVILKVENPGEEDAEEATLVGVEDEEILNEVYRLFKESHGEEFDFAD